MTSKKFAAILCAVAFVIGVHQFTSTAANAGSGDLAILLPESDGVIVLDSKRLVYEALPQILSSNTHILSKIDSEIEKIEGRTGFDLRKFDEVAIGLNYKEIDGKSKFDGVLLARGNFDTGSLENVAKEISHGKYRIETIGGRKIFVFSAKKLVKSKKPVRIKNDVLDGMMGKLFNGLSDEVAITAYDSTTVAIGSFERVKATIGNSPRISNDLLSLIGGKPEALANLAMTFPTGMSQFIELEDDELGENLDSIREIQASLDVNDGTTSISIAARSAEADKAENLAFTLKALKGFATGILRQNKSADKQAYSRMLERVEISQSEYKIFVDLTVPKSDLDEFIGKK